MATFSLTQHYTIKEFQLLVKDSPVVPAEIQPFVGVSFRSSADIYRLFKGASRDDGRNLPGGPPGRQEPHGGGMTTCSIGSMTASLVHPRDIFRPAIANMTAGLIFIHNHPSGDPAPSDEDMQITKRLCEVGKVIGIKCLDHIIIGSGRYFSFADQGLMS